MKKMKMGFTLVEIMIVVAIIAILAAVAIPNFIKYRRSSQATACVSNLKQIQTAKEQCAVCKLKLNMCACERIDQHEQIERDVHDRLGRPEILHHLRQSGQVHVRGYRTEHAQ